MLDVPAGVVPVTTVNGDDVEQMADYPEHNETYRAIKQASACMHAILYHGSTPPAREYRSSFLYNYALFARCRMVLIG